MKVRYNKQINKYSCGPIAVLNALKWRGNDSVTYKDLPIISKLCECGKHGTRPINLVSCLKHFHFTFYKRTKLSIKEIKELLQKDKAIIVDFYWDKIEYRGHFVLLVSGNTKGSINIINFLKENDKRTILEMSKKDQQKYLIRNVKEGFLIISRDIKI